ncbi:hypothetical protein DRJ17_00345 [Candidatus Woesearchaeota archaeon]|nr:MAG: hypothetical protein DRJ17_00345 [Candidatus Woesearchaeota archaeon]
MKIILQDHEPDLNSNSEELANVIINRIGLMPRKKGSTEQMNRVLVELYERAKEASRERQPEKAVITVEEMAFFAGITRQTMYDYLKRWIDLDLIKKTSYIKDSKVIIGYKLNGNTLESAFEKTAIKIRNNTEKTAKLILELQKLLKNEKISKSQRQNTSKNIE